MDISRRAIVVLLAPLAFGVISYATPAPDTKEHNPSIANAAAKDYDARKIRGIYLNAWQAAKKGRLESLIDGMERSGLNAAVVDIKSNAGEVLYNTEVRLARQIMAVHPALGDLDSFIRKFHERGMYVIARQVVFNDPILAKMLPSLAVRDSIGNIWSGEMRNRFVPWVDPYADQVRAYNLDIMREAIKAGIDEVQFDYIRFPARAYLVYTHERKDIQKIEALNKFLRDAREITSQEDVKLGIDVFGFSVVNKGDLGIGHSFAELAQHLDVISPMLYPSHYYRGNFGFDRPQDHPFEVIRRSVEEANRMVPSTCIVRPWIQDFGWNTPLYRANGPAYVMEEIRGVLKGGSTSFLIWNAASNYDASFMALSQR